ncbi:MAG: hypothetical protein ACREBR_03930, partial [bacterium]
TFVSAYNIRLFTMDPILADKVELSGLTVAQRNALSNQGVNDIETFATMDSDAFSDVFSSNGLRNVNGIVKLRLRAI